MTDQGIADPPELQSVVNGIRAGRGTDKGMSIVCIPDEGEALSRTKRTTLKKLSAPGMQREAERSGLITISEANRFKGKVDWPRVAADVRRWRDKGLSVGLIAKRLGVTISALSKANSRFGLYPNSELN